MINIKNVGKRIRMVREFFKFTQQKMSEVLPDGAASLHNLIENQFNLPDDPGIFHFVGASLTVPVSALN